MTEPINPNTPQDPANPAPPAGDNPPANPPAPPQPDNALAAQLRIAQKELDRLKKAEEDRKKAEMTEAERLKAEADEARKEAEALRRENTITKLANKAGLPEDLWDFIKGNSAEEIEASITKLSGFVKPAQPAPAHTGQAPNNPPAPAPQSPKAEWLRLKASDPQAAAAYYAKNRDAIIKE